MLEKKILCFSLLFILAGLLTACGRLQEVEAGIDLEVTAFTADQSTFATTIVNGGTLPAASFEVTFTLDEIYLGGPDSNTVSVESLGAGETISLEILNDLSSAEGRGEHYAIVRVDSNSQVSERDELNNSESVYYYDGEYLDEYTAMRANLPSWVTEIKDRLNSEYDFSCTGVVYLRLVDDMGNISGSMAAPYLFGSSEVTPVLMFNLKRLHDGYTTYESGGVIYTSDTSQEVIFHEYTHAYHCYYAIDNQGIWPPAWFREGFAVYVAGHGPGIVKRMIYKCKVSGEAFAETADRIMDGLQSDEEHDAYDYAEDYLALQYIVSNYGQSSLKNIVRDSSFGASIEVAVLDNIAESDWDTFEESVNTYGRASIEAIYPLVN